MCARARAQVFLRQNESNLTRFSALALSGLLAPPVHARLGCMEGRD